MDLNKMQSWLAAPFACVILILTVLTLSPFRPPSTGIKIPLLRLKPRKSQLSCDGQFVFVQLLSSGETRVNGQAVAEDKDLAPLIHSIMASRAERVVYVVPDSRIGYGRFVTSLGILQNATTDLHIAVLSGRLRNEFTEGSLEPCDFAWPEEETAAR